MAWYLAIEGGGTRTTAGLYEDDRLVKEGVAGPSNPMAYGVSATAGTRRTGDPTGAAIGRGLYPARRNLRSHVACHRP